MFGYLFKADWIKLYGRYRQPAIWCCVRRSCQFYSSSARILAPSNAEGLWGITGNWKSTYQGIEEVAGTWVTEKVRIEKHSDYLPLER